MGVDLSGNSIQSSHVIKCFGGCESQRKPSGQREWFLLALPLQDSSNIRAVTSNTTEVSQWKFLLCHGQHIKIKKFLKLSTAQRLCMSAFQILQPFEKLPHGPASLSDATALFLVTWITTMVSVERTKKGKQDRFLPKQPPSSWVLRGLNEVLGY